MAKSAVTQIGFLGAAAFVLMLGTIPLRADPSPPAQASPVPTVPLSAWLPKAPISNDHLVIAVDPGKTVLSPGDAPPQNGDNLTAIAAAFGQAAWDFGGVTAVGPARIWLLNTPPDTLDAYADLGRQDLLRLFVSSLADNDYQRLLSEGGIGIDDLETDEQRTLFRHLLPGDSLSYRSSSAQRDDPNNVMTVTLTSLPRLRLSRSVEMSLPSKDPDHPRTRRHIQDGQARYIIVYPPKTLAAGTPIIDKAENAPKRSDLDFGLKSLDAVVTVPRSGTVKEIVAACAQASGIEIYADRHYADRTVVALGARSAPAKDLLQAVAFCLGAAYRQVGSAYVLTDAIEGVGARQTAWTEFVTREHNLRTNDLKDADRVIAEHHRRRADISFFGDPAAPSREQLGKQEQEIGPAYGLTDDLTVMVLPFSSLTPGQQHLAQLQEAAEPGTTAHGGSIIIRTHCSLDLLTPIVDGPVQIVDCTYLLYPLGFEMPPPAAAVPAETPVSAAWKAIRMALPRRAVYAAPRTSEELERLLNAMSALGMNELWLGVFSHGERHFGASGPDGDLLRKAREETRRRGIRLYTSFDLLDWNDSVPDEWLDRTITGQTAQSHAQMLAERYTGPDNDLDQATQDANDSKKVIVRPSAPGLVDALANAMNEAVRYGPDGVVWREAAGEGYTADSDWDTSQWLGYTPNERLAFLRGHALDPIDLPGGTGGLHTNLPAYNSEKDRDYLADWNGFLCDEETKFLQNLRECCKSSLDSHGIPLIVETPAALSPQSWYGSWDDPAKQPPSLTPIALDADLGEASHAVSHIAYAPVLLEDDANRTPRQTILSTALALGIATGFIPNQDDATIAGVLKSGKAPAQLAPWSGYVLDATGPRGIDILETLAH